MISFFLNAVVLIIYFEPFFNTEKTLSEFWWWLMNCYYLQITTRNDVNIWVIQSNVIDM